MSKKSSSVDSLGLKEFANKRARKAVAKYLEIFRNREPELLFASSAIDELRLLGNEAIPAMAEEMIHGTKETMAISAAFLWAVSLKTKAMVPQTMVLRCQKVLLDSLAPDGVPLLTCILLTNVPAPPNTIPQLNRWVENQNLEMAVIAAVALLEAASNAELRIDVFKSIHLLGKVLRSEPGLTGNTEVLTCLAAKSLLLHRLREGESVQKLRSILGRLTPEGQYGVLTSLRSLGAAALPLFEVVTGILSNEDGPPPLRGMAAIVLGEMTKGTDRATQPLMKAVRCRDWQVVDGGLSGFIAAGGIPDAAIGRMIELLSHDDDKMKIIAANGIASMGSRAASALEALIDRIGTEQKLDVIEYYVNALTAIGEPALSRLISVLVDGDSHRYESAARAISGMGNFAAMALAEVLRKSENSRVQQTIIGTLLLMGRRATPAIPIMTDILENAEDDATVQQVVIRNKHGDTAFCSIA